MNASTSKKSRKFALMGIVVALALAGLAFVGCAGQQQSSLQAASSASSSESSSAPASPAPIAQGDVLVAYFSASGNTERVAQQIASDLDADTFVITPAEPYTSEDLNWNQEGSRVNIEHENESARDIELTQVTPDGWDGYDTVFIGYPRLGLLTDSCPATTLTAKRSSPSARPPRPAWGRAPIFWSRWQTAARGSKG